MPSTKPTSSRYQTEMKTYGDHGLKADIDSVLQKVNMNSAFTNLCKNDSELVNGMKTAIEQLYAQAKKREILYIAVEHNTKYLTQMSRTMEIERDAAVSDNAILKTQIAQINKESETMKRTHKAL